MFDAELVNLLLLTDVLQYSCSEKCRWVNREIILLDLLLINMQQTEVLFKIVVLEIMENTSLTPCLTLFWIRIFGAAHGWWSKKAPASLKCHAISCNNETWHSYTLSKENSKNHATQLSSSADISIFSPEIRNFFKKTDIDCILIHNF